MRPIARLPLLAARVDAHAERVAHAYPHDLACQRGCHDCCAPGLTVARIEADAVSAYLGALPLRERHVLGGSLARRHDRCAALLQDGGCALYPARPLVCRSHGVPIRLEPDEPSALGGVEACSLNFTRARAAGSLGSLPPEHVLDQRTLSTILGALDAAHADERGAARGERVPLAELVGEWLPSP